MISPETRAQIRRYRYAEHWKIGTIVSELRIHPDAVRNAIEVNDSKVRNRNCAAPWHDSVHRNMSRSCNCKPSTGK